MKQFSEFALVWYSEQFAVPFWMIGHIHLHLNDYHAVIEGLSSVIMNIMVAAGFWIAWKEHKN